MFRRPHIMKLGKYAVVSRTQSQDHTFSYGQGPIFVSCAALDPVNEWLF